MFDLQISAKTFISTASSSQPAKHTHSAKLQKLHRSRESSRSSQPVYLHGCSSLTGAVARVSSIGRRYGTWVTGIRRWMLGQIANYDTTTSPVYVYVRFARVCAFVRVASLYTWAQHASASNRVTSNWLRTRPESRMYVDQAFETVEWKRESARSVIEKKDEVNEEGATSE